MTNLYRENNEILLRKHFNDLNIKNTYKYMFIGCDNVIYP